MTSTRRPTQPRRRNRRGSGEQLRADIVDATKALLAESGNADAVSIRAVADAVGVTSPSIYLHFADKTALIEAVVTDVFADLDAAMLTAGESVDQPMQRLCEYGMAYIRFARDHPQHYRVAMMGLTADDMRPSDLVLAEAAVTHMQDAVQACMDAGIYDQGDPTPIVFELWAAAHGVASLLIVKPFLPWGDAEAFAYGVLRSVGVGRALNDVLGGDLDPTTATAWLVAQREARGGQP